MPRVKTCSFCSKEIEPGTGMMYVRKDGTVFTFCSSKCERNMIKLKRKPRKVRWTQTYRKEKMLRVK
ncbi:MAG: 50S ribosomal protein L24e [Methanomicrobia archaeon]|nr:50S ribosomal protein L24e [Methanomicrobia archaeon]MCK4433733.1 50S ribosomal protein L24e [Methanomicrobia archaeon]MCK4637368.1 50S ribosomal protein L24e [Methanomicrobia archaeon]